MIQIPSDLLPADGRFGSGPAKIRPEAMRRLGESNSLMGTSHRQSPIKNLVASVQDRLAQLYQAPEDYQVVLGNGGATLFWDMACASLIRRQSSHAVFGAFTKKFASASANAPFLDAPLITEAANGELVLPNANPDVDVVAWAQNETSTGVMAPVKRLPGFADDALFLIDATSAAGGLKADLSQCDGYYFSPQKNFSSDGGLWLAILSPAAIERAKQLTSGTDGRWVPDILNLTKAVTNSAKHQTLNTPAIATLILLDDQLGWLLDQGGIDFAEQRCAESTSAIYDWAESRDYVSPFVTDEANRSKLVATIEFDQRIEVAKLLQILRENAIIDLGAYRGVGKNQMRVGCYSSVDPADVQALLACIDWVIDRL